MPLTPNNSRSGHGKEPPDSVADSTPIRRDELAWMRKVAGGDEEAIHDLLDCYQSGIRALIGRLTAWSSDVDDITQEVFLKAWQRAHQFTQQTSLQNWLYTIAVNQCRNHRRSLYRWWKMLDGLFEEKRNAQVVTSLEPHDQTQAWNELQQALLQLKSADREILVFTYMEEKSTAEIAQILSISENNLYVRLHRAKERLAQQLNPARREVK